MASQSLSQWIFLLRLRAWSLPSFLNCMLSFRMFGVKDFMNIFKFLFRVVFGGLVFSSFFFFSSTLDCSSDFVYRFMPLYFDAGNAIAFFLFLVPMYALRTLRYCQSLKSFMHNHVLIWIKDFGLILIGLHWRGSWRRISSQSSTSRAFPTSWLCSFQRLGMSFCFLGFDQCMVLLLNILVSKQYKVESLIH